MCNYRTGATFLVHVNMSYQEKAAFTHVVVDHNEQAVCDIILRIVCVVLARQKTSHYFAQFHSNGLCRQRANVAC